MTLGGLGQADAAVVDVDPVDVVKDLRDRPGGDIGVHASISVAQALAGGARGPARNDQQHLSPTGSLLLHYRVIR